MQTLEALVVVFQLVLVVDNSFGLFVVVEVAMHAILAWLWACVIRMWRFYVGA